MKYISISLIIAGASASVFANIDNNTEKDEIETITVQGSKLQSSLIKLPASVSVIDKEQIKTARVNNLTDIEQFVPNLKFSQLGEVGAQFISIRGIGANPLSENRVAVYIDDIPYRTINDKVLMDISQIEVLRGPQGTLYGANTEGGVIVINSALIAPEFKVKGEVASEHFSAGNRNSVNMQMSGQFNELWSGRIAINREQGDTYSQNIDPLTNSRGEIKDTSVFATLNYYPSERLTATLQYAADFNRAEGIYEQTYIPMNAALYNQVFAQPNPALLQSFGVAQVNQLAIANRYEYHMDDQRIYDESERSLNFKLRYDWDEHSFISVTNLINKESDGVGAQFELTSLPLINTGALDERDQIFQEFRLLFPEQDGLSWVAGLSLYKGERKFTVHSKDILGLQTEFNSLVPLFEESKDIAVFASGSLTLAEDWLVSLGGRYEKSNRRSFRKSDTRFILGGQVAAVFPQLNEEADFDEFLPKLALSYQVTDDTSVYASASKGWQPGGFNDDAFADEESRAKGVKFSPETIWNYELGAKGSTVSNTLYWSLSVFASKAKDWQEMNFLRDAQGKAVSTSVVINAAKLDSSGIEAEFKWQVTDKVKLYGGLGYTDSEYKEFNIINGTGFSGNSSIMMPKSSANLNLDYQVTDDVEFSLNLSSVGDMYLDLDNQVKQSDYQVLDANLRWQLGQYELTLFAENLTDEYYFTGQAFADFTFPVEGLYFSSPAKPKRIGLSIAAEF